MSMRFLGPSLGAAERESKASLSPVQEGMGRISLARGREESKEETSLEYPSPMLSKMSQLCRREVA